jgi:pimeloyl-ACP methyl ester carboxylesterase
MRSLALHHYLLLILTSCAATRLVPLPAEVETHRAKTDDGWEIALTRYRPRGTPTGLPVILCHGISANARNVDLDERHSLARWLAAHGREAWTMSVRGAGDSDGIDEEKGRRPPINFDSFWRFDLPAVIRHVRLVTGARAVDYVGHSMGGLVVYAYLSQGGEGINAAATLGTPTRLDWGTGLETWLKAIAPKLLSAEVMIPSALGAHLAAPFQTLVDDGPFQRFFYNPQSTTAGAWQRLLAYGTADVAGGVALQLLAMLDRGRFQSFDGSVDFKKDMVRITTPVLVVAARLDRVALAPGVKDGYRALGGPKQWLLITRANGAQGEYGHMDLVIAERAADEVWAPVLDFLNRHAPR